MCEFVFGIYEIWVEEGPEEVSRGAAARFGNVHEDKIAVQGEPLE